MAADRRLRERHDGAPSLGRAIYRKSQVKAYSEPRPGSFFLFWEGHLKGGAYEHASPADSRECGSISIASLGWIACNRVFVRVTSPVPKKRKNAAQPSIGNSLVRFMRILERVFHVRRVHSPCGARSSVARWELRRSSSRSGLAQPIKPTPRINLGSYSLPFFHMPHNVFAKVRATLRQAVSGCCLSCWVQ